MTKQIPSLRHQAARPVGVETVGFARQLASYCGVYLGRQRVIPDAFRVEIQRRTIRVFEVIVTHELHAEKMTRYRMLRDLLAELGWKLRLVASGSDGRYRNVNWETGRMVTTARTKRWAINRLATLKLPIEPPRKR